MSQFTVYRYRPDLDATLICNLGCKHRVTYHEVKRITLVGNESKWIKGLHYTSDGWGNERIAKDAQGREYRSQDSWDGYSGWMRDGKASEVFFGRPVLRMDAAFDLLGNTIA